MDVTAIFTLIQKGLSLLPILIQAGEDVGSAVTNLQKLADAGAAGTSISDADLATIEAQFDSDLAEFNKPMT
jgi:hypothetical protein